MRKKIIAISLITLILNMPEFDTARRVDGATEELIESMFRTFIVVAIVLAVLFALGRILSASFMSARAAGRVVGGAPEPILDEDARDSSKRTETTRAAY